MEADLSQSAFAKTNAIAAELGIPCYWPNLYLPESPENVHLRASVGALRPRVVSTCGKTRRKWLLQIAVYVRDGVGVIAPAEIGDDIAAKLPLNAVITGSLRTYTITEPMDTSIEAVRDGGWYAKPYQVELEHID